MFVTVPAPIIEMAIPVDTDDAVIPMLLNEIFEELLRVNAFPDELVFLIMLAEAPSPTNAMLLCADTPRALDIKYVPAGNFSVPPDTDAANAIAEVIAFVSSVMPSPLAPKSLTLMDSLSLV